MQRVQYQPVFCRPDDDQLTMTREDDSPQRPLGRVLQCFQDHAIRGHGDRVGGSQIETAAGQQNQIELPRIDRTLQTEHLVIIRPNCSQIIVGQLDVSLGFVRIALGDLVVGYFTMLGAAFPVRDTLAAAGMQLAERAARCQSGRVRLDRNAQGGLKSQTQSRW